MSAAALLSAFTDAIARRDFAVPAYPATALRLRRLIAGDRYTIADIAIFPWYGWLVKGWIYDAAEFLSVQDYKHVQRWADELLQRPAVQRGRMVNRVSGEPSSQLHERHDASDFDLKTADKQPVPESAK